MKSRFLNVSPRAYIRQKDSVNILPEVERTGYENETGTSPSAFSESESTIFFRQNQVLLAPYMVPASIASSSGFLTGNIYVTGSYQDSTAFLDQNVVNPSVFPFKEASNPASYGNLPGEDEGFPEEILPGFSSPESDKIALVFDISATAATPVIKLSRLESLRDPAGPFFGSEGSGFLYYNNRLNRWADVGSRDPSTGQIQPYDPVMRITDSLAAESGSYDISPQSEDKIVGQFSSSPYSITSEGPNYVPGDINSLKARGYDKIGEPTSFFGAPSEPRYHAPSSYSYKMSDRISNPIVIDRISVKIPVTAYRTQIPCTGSGGIDAGYGRDIDNYVFFVYAQNRSNATSDSKQDVSSSIRYLIGKESFCVYNPNTLNEVSSGLEPVHSYGQSIPISMASDVATVTSGSSVRVSKDVEINMTFRPATFNSTFGATSKIAGKVKVSGGSGKPITGSLFIQNFWRGGQQGIGFRKNAALLSGTSNLNVKTGSISPSQTNLLAIASPRSLIASFWDATPDTINSGSGFTTSTTSEISTVSTGEFTQITPVVIFPGDELIFGIESGANSNMFSPGRSYNGVDTDVLNSTGSALLIRKGEARVTIYGSLIADKREVLPSTNQYLGSDAVHEDIHEEGPFDQFDICDKTILSASYVDNIVNGNMFLGNRKRVALSTRNQNWITGSLQRNVRLVSDSTYYDTLVPTVPVISGGIENSTSVKYNDATFDPAALKIISGSTNGFAFENNRSSDQLMKRSFTYENTPSGEQKRIKSLKLVLYENAGSGVSYLRTHLADESKFVLYYNGYNPTIPILQAYNKNYSGAVSLRYGLHSTRLSGPVAVFRRDHFGFMRDMLEQPRDGKLVFTNKGKENITQAVVVATFVSSSSDIVTDAIYTQCSNLSSECTSSVPFIDDNQTHNRGNDVPAFLPIFGANNLLFGVTGSFGAQ